MDSCLKCVFLDIVQSSGQFQKFLSGETFEENCGLWNVADPLFHVDGSFRQGKSDDRNLPCAWGQDAGDDFERGGFPRPIGTEQPHYLATVEGEGDFVQNFRGSITKHDFGKLDDRFRHGRKTPGAVF